MPVPFAASPRFAQQGPEGVPNGVYVNRPAPFVPFRNPRKLQVPVEDSHQPGGNGEDKAIGRQLRYGGRQR